MSTVLHLKNFNDLHERVRERIKINTHKQKQIGTPSHSKSKRKRTPKLTNVIMLHLPKMSVRAQLVTSPDRASPAQKSFQTKILRKQHKYRNEGLRNSVATIIYDRVSVLANIERAS